MIASRRMEQVALFEDKGPKFSISPHPHVEMHEGSPMVQGSRVPVRRIWNFHRRGTPIATLVARYPRLGPASVLSALAFAYDNQDLVEWDSAKNSVCEKCGWLGGGMEGCGTHRCR